MAPVTRLGGMGWSNALVRAPGFGPRNRLVELVDVVEVQGPDASDCVEPEDEGPRGLERTPVARAYPCVDKERRTVGHAGVVLTKPDVGREIDQRPERLEVNARTVHRLPTERPVVLHDEVGAEQRAQGVPVPRGDTSHESAYRRGSLRRRLGCYPCGGPPNPSANSNASRTRSMTSPGTAPT